MTSIKPLGKRLLVQRNEQAQEKGGIILPDTKKDKPQEGRVLAVGPGAINDDGVHENCSIQKGQEVLFSSYAGTEVNIDDKEYLIVSDEEVLAIVE